jgi:hypothetical protein
MNYNTNLNNQKKNLFSFYSNFYLLLTKVLIVEEYLNRINNMYIQVQLYEEEIQVHDEIFDHLQIHHLENGGQ